MKIHLFFFILLFWVTILPGLPLHISCITWPCKTFCDDDEYDYGYCIKWRNQCCI
ncbi:PREDICTED: beta-defensin 110 [Hipposideros armiger]|uniref:Beta-defensin 110 n=1 Tax=Hipposideros armiger TaxID=186990 RepID=A0A8B7Q4M3_HIPAR|nr:PREDICTED: beta-defensin 110 [Hipposideros armiger]